MFFGSGPIASAPIGSTGLPEIVGYVTQSLGGMTLSAAGVAQRTGDLSITLGAVTAASVAFAGTQGLLSSTLGAWSSDPQTYNLLPYSLPGGTGWQASGGGTITDGTAYGSMPAKTIASNGADWNRAETTSTHNLLPGRTYYCKVIYRGGTSGQVRLVLRHNTTANESQVNGAVGTLATVVQAAGTIGSVVNTSLGSGVYQVTFTFVPAFGTGQYQVSIGPNSNTVGQTVDGIHWQIGNVDTTAIVIDTSTPTYAPHAVVGIGSVLTKTLGTLTSSGAGSVSITADLSKSLGGLSLTTFGGPIGAVTLNQTLGAISIHPRANHVTKSNFGGTVPGTPGTPYTGGSFYNPNAMTIQTVGSGVENGRNYIDIRFTGTSVGTGNVEFGFYDMNTTVLFGQNWTASCYVRLVGGTTTGVTQRIQVNHNDSLGNYITNTNTLTAAPTSTEAVFSHTTKPATPATARIFHSLAYFFANGVAIDMTVRVSGPQMEPGTVVTAFMPTTSAIAYGPHTTVDVQAVLTKALGSLTGASTALASIVGVLTKTMNPMVIQPRINYVPDSTMSGGTSSALPPTWSFQPAAGLTQAVVAKGVNWQPLLGRYVEYIDWSVTGTVGGATVYPALNVMPNNVAPIIYGQQSTASVYGLILSGSVPAGAGGVLLLQQVYSSASSYLNGYSNSGYLDGTFNRITTTGAPTSVGAAYARALLAFGNGIPPGSVVNVVIRVYAPQMEIGEATANTYVPTAGTIAYGSHAGAGIVMTLAKTLGTLTLSGLVGVGIASALAQTLDIIQPVNKNVIGWSHLKSGSTLFPLATGITDNGLDMTATDPFGNAGARKFTYAGGGGFVRLKSGGSDFDGTNGLPMNGSVYMKTADGSTVNVQLDLNDVPATTVSVGPTWTRLSASATVNSKFRFLDVNPVSAAAFHIYGAQITDGSTTLLSYVENVAAPTTMLTGPVVTGTLNRTIGAWTFSGLGVIGVAAVLAKTLGAVTLSASATHPVVGALNKALGAVTSIATVAVRWKKRWVFFVG